MDKKILLVSALLALLLFGASAGTVTRSLSAAEVAPGQDITVTLTARIESGETFYAVDEIFPADWTVKDAGSGATGHAGHVKWAVIENAVDTTYSYVLTAPSQAGTGRFSGKYMFEGMESEVDIAGQKQASVKQASTGPDTTVSGGIGDPIVPILGGLVAIAVVAFLVLTLAKRKKTQQSL